MVHECKRPKSSIFKLSIFSLSALTHKLTTVPIAHAPRVNNNVMPMGRSIKSIKSLFHNDLYLDDTGNFFSASGNSFSVSGSGDSFLTTVEQLPTSLEHQSFECSNITCQEGFYCVADIGCNPSCASWKQYPQSTNALIDSLLLMSTCIGIICAVGVLIVTGLRWKKVYD